MSFFTHNTAVESDSMFFNAGTVGGPMVGSKVEPLLAGARRFRVLARTVLASAVVTAIGGTVARADTLYVSNYTAGTISKVLANGTTTAFATGLTTPEGMVLDKTGNLFVANQQSGVIDKVSPSGTVSPFVTISSAAGDLAGLAMDKSGNLYVSVQLQGLIDEITPSGGVSTFATGVGNPQGLAFDTAGNLYCADINSNTVFRTTPGGTTTPFTSGVTFPLGLTFDGMGDLFVTGGSTYNDIEEVTPGGTVSPYAVVGFPGELAGLAFDSTGDLYCAKNIDGSGGGVYEITPASVITPFGTGYSGADYVVDQSTSIPEPASSSLAALAASALLGRRRRVQPTPAK